jgi:large subunit ribosomal protein L13
MNYKIDASGKILGRVASEAATILRGKNDPKFAPNVLSKNTVEVINAKDLKVSGDKAKTKSYSRYSGYPGGLRQKTFADFQIKSTGKVLYKAIWGMLPKNRLRSKIIKNLKIS